MNSSLWVYGSHHFLVNFGRPWIGGPQDLPSPNLALLHTALRVPHLIWLQLFIVCAFRRLVSCWALGWVLCGRAYSLCGLPCPPSFACVTRWNLQLMQSPASVRLITLWFSISSARQILGARFMIYLAFSGISLQLVLVFWSSWRSSCLSRIMQRRWSGITTLSTTLAHVALYSSYVLVYWVARAEHSALLCQR